MTTHELAQKLLADPCLPVRIPSAWYPKEDNILHTSENAFRQPYIELARIKVQSNICYLFPIDEDTI